MDLTIYWTLYAQNRLEEIFIYYKIEANIDVARKLILEIIDKTTTATKTGTHQVFEHPLDFLPAATPATSA